MNIAEAARSRLVGAIGTMTPTDFPRTQANTLPGIASCPFRICSYSWSRPPKAVCRKSFGTSISAKKSLLKMHPPNLLISSNAANSQRMHFRRFCTSSMMHAALLHCSKAINCLPVMVLDSPSIPIGTGLPMSEGRMDTSPFTL